MYYLIRGLKIQKKAGVQLLNMMDFWCLLKERLQTCCRDRTCDLLDTGQAY